jgi:nicotinamide phosphoribosyltransferase
MSNFLRINSILDVDSYKSSHSAQYPPNSDWMYSYLESRGGRYDKTVFFGLQYLMKEYLEGSFCNETDVENAAEFFSAHGEPFPREGWMRIANHHDGRLPIRIKAVPEGTVVPTHNVLMSVESTDPEVFWLVSWLETQFVRMWYPVTVATQSWHIKRNILGYLQKTCEDPMEVIPFNLHDFGSRGVSSRESAGIGGMAHLVNFRGSDTVEGVRYANHYYNCPMAAFSIPAAEHSTITMWGRERETEAYRNMLTQFAKPGTLVACVSDSYDFYNAVENIWAGELHEEVKSSDAGLVIRPDSGHPPEVVRKTLELLDKKVGCTKNKLGFKVLPVYFRVIQGDGVNEHSINEILETVVQAGFSAENVNFGMGGALLQQLDRDTQKFAFKCSAARVDGKVIPVYKDPATDPGKKSKRGVQSLVLGKNGLTTVEGADPNDQLEVVFENGRIIRETTLDEVRARADSDLM